ncbi:MAG: DNA helicase RecG, partial [Symploca sp. SIO2D2]|nr:DNA helicase RecG [Symploca sp. SIO2D2]
MATELPNWVRLQKALSVEAEKGFTDLMGNQYRFSEFLCLSFGETYHILTVHEQRRWATIARDFASYPQMTPQQRQHLVAEARRFLQELQQAIESRLAGEVSQPSQFKSPRTTPLIASKNEETATNRRVTLDQPLAELKAVGVRKSRHLERLGLHQVRDILFYYPRDHIDYANQVNISNLVVGETVTIMGTVKRCNCFTSPRNKKLTILEVILKDSTGQIKLNRFFAGTRYSNRGWQYQQKSRYASGAVVAASGLVKKNKYGVTLENPELEVLDQPGASIESMKIGRVLPVYPLTEGVPA